MVFAWNGEKQDNFDIYVKLIGSPTSVRLTTNPAADFDPVFSPDGRSIGFVRWAGGKASFIVIPALGGPERVVVDNLTDVDGSYLTRILESYGRAFDWLPDGKWIVTEGLNLLSIESGETRKLTIAGQPASGSRRYSRTPHPPSHRTGEPLLSAALHREELKNSGFWT